MKKRFFWGKKEMSLFIALKKDNRRQKDKHVLSGRTDARKERKTGPGQAKNIQLNPINMLFIE